ncbi:unnamed protein product [Peronospora destructor]|uniref:Uncharacterized protein n=1 Tax=Peronospora destructor TaxID=86335 RepID=A0AAV0TQS9_9STRA|nr:unnamed protein product [Peronospora destructor]
MDVDEGAQWPATWQRPLSPPRELRVTDKRRRLNDVAVKDQRELAELLQLVDEDEAGRPTSALRLSAASASPASVLSVYAHNAPRFTCTLCRHLALPRYVATETHGTVASASPTDCRQDVRAAPPSPRG